MPIVHVIAGLIVLGYANNYYFHLRKFSDLGDIGPLLGTRSWLKNDVDVDIGHHKNNAH